MSLVAVVGALSGCVWSADFETGDLSQWRIGNPGGTVEADSGACARPPTGVTTQQAHSGRYSMEMVIDSTTDAGCRQFRKPEPATGNPYYYSAWYYVPEPTRVGTFWNVFQFKSNSDGGPGSDAFWKLEIRDSPDGTMRVVPIWKGPVPGPQATDGIAGRAYPQARAVVPVAKWFQLEVYLQQSEQYDGQIVVWQDGVEILNLRDVRTKHPGGTQSWSVNNYGRGLQPNPTTLYIDDVVISTARLSRPPGA